MHSFELIVNEHKNMVFVYLLALTREAPLAEDLTQETFLAAFENLAKGTKVESVAAWLRGIARNLAAQAIRRKSKERALLLNGEVVEQAMAPLDDSALGDQWEDHLDALRSCREKLPEHLQRALRMHYEEKNSAAVIAERTGWQRATVHQLLWSARSLLQKCISRRISVETQGL